MLAPLLVILSLTSAVRSSSWACISAETLTAPPWLAEVERWFSLDCEVRVAGPLALILPPAGPKARIILNPGIILTRGCCKGVALEQLISSSFA